MTLGPLMELLTVLATAALGNSTGTVTNDDANLRIEWKGSARCRPTKDVIDGLHLLLGTDPERLLNEPLPITASIDETAQGWSLLLSIPGPRGAVERRIEAASCEEIAQAASLIISLWVQPSRAPETSVESRARPKAPSASPKAVPAADGATAIPRATRAPLLTTRVMLAPGRLRLRRVARLPLRVFVGPALLYGALPELGWGIKAGLGTSLDHWEFSLAILWLDQQHLQTTAPTAAAGSFGLLAASARVARVYRMLPWVQFQPGLWALVGRLHAEASGASLQASTPSEGDWGAGGLGVNFSMPVRRFTANLELGGGLPFGRPRFWVGEQPLYRTSAIVGFGMLGVGVAFP